MHLTQLAPSEGDRYFRYYQRPTEGGTTNQFWTTFLYKEVCDFVFQNILCCARSLFHRRASVNFLPFEASSFLETCRFMAMNHCVCSHFPMVAMFVVTTHSSQHATTWRLHGGVITSQCFVERGSILLAPLRDDAHSSDPLGPYGPKYVKPRLSIPKVWLSAWNRWVLQDAPACSSICHPPALCSAMGKSLRRTTAWNRRRFER